MSYHRQSPEATLFNLLFPLILFAGAVLLVLALIGLYVLVRSGILVGRVFCRYPRHSGLWLSLIIFLLLCVTGIALAASTRQGLAFWLLPMGAMQLLISCKSVEISHTQRFIPAEKQLIDKVLHTSWTTDFTV